MQNKETDKSLDILYDYFKTRFEAENTIKEGFYQKNSFLIGAMVLTATFALYFCRTDFTGKSFSVVFVIEYLLMILGVLCFLKASYHVFWMTYDCAMKNMPDENEIVSYSKKVDEAVLRETLVEKLANASSCNYATNTRRGRHFYKSEIALFFAFAFFAVFAIVDITMCPDDKDKPVLDDRPMEKTGSGKGVK